MLTAEAIKVQGTKISSKHTGRTDKYSSTLIYTIIHSHLSNTMKIQRKKVKVSPISIRI